MIEKPQNFDSVFRYIVVVSQRAEQLINGAKARSDTRHAKPTLVAKADVDGGLVEWRVLTQEELDAQRQAIVEQFRAEVGGDTAAPEAAKRIPDVLPTSVTFSGLDEDDEGYDEDRDDELDRLQRLLGMAGRTRSEADEGEAEAEGGEDEGEDEGGEDEGDGDDGGDDLEDGDEEIGDEELDLYEDEERDEEEEEDE